MKIIIIEDDLVLAQGVKLALAKEGYEVICCASLKAARQVLDKEPVSLIILDINLPDGDGLEFCRTYQQVSSTPILMLTAKDTEQDEIDGLMAGARDYITKPFHIGVLRARVKVLLKDTKDTQKHTYGDCVFDFQNWKFSKGQQELQFSKAEQKVLYMLVQNEGQTLTREQLIEKVWDTPESVDENTLSVTIKRLRNKIGADMIQMVYGIGYRFVVRR